jgi:hypothetical protein
MYYALSYADALGLHLLNSSAFSFCVLTSCQLHDAIPFCPNTVARTAVMLENCQ